MVYFDNFTLSHEKSSLMEESHYYPFGLTMAGISSKAAGKGLDCGCGNKKGYNGNEIQAKEFSDGSGLDVYDFNARTYDQQIGRFIQVGPLTEEGGQESLSPFHFSYNNPTTFSDPDGRCPICPAIPVLVEGAKILVTAVVAYVAAKEAAPVVTDAIMNTEAPTLPRGNAPAMDQNAFMPQAARILKAKTESSSSTQDARQKPVPNPNGKKGGQAHQDKTDEVENTLRDQGYDKIEREVMVPTLEGEKSKRFIDLRGTNAKTGQVIDAQIGKQNKNGSPVSRERRAAEDIERVMKRPPLFFPYN